MSCYSCDTFRGTSLAALIADAEIVLGSLLFSSYNKILGDVVYASGHNFVASTRVVLLQLNNYKIAKNK